MSYPYSPAAERNKDPILQVLQKILPSNGEVFEIASGSGQHLLHFAKALPQLNWQPSEFDKELCHWINTQCSQQALANVKTALALDVTALPWPINQADAVININMIHITPWTATEALFSGAGQVLDNGGLLFCYGPYHRHGKPTAASNQAFDQQLRAQNPQWGIRDIDDLSKLAQSNGLTLSEVIGMPSNNFSLVFRKTDQ